MEFRLGQKILLESFQELGPRYETRIADVAEAALYVEPLYDLSRRTFRSFVPEGTEFVAFVSGGDGAAYRFPTRVLGVRRDQIWLVALRRPRDEELVRVQRRGYLRVPVLLDLRVRRNEGEEFPAVSRDISAGGISFYLPPGILLSLGERIAVNFSLRLASGERRDFSPEGEVVRVFEDSGMPPRTAAAVRFLRLSPEEERFLVRYSFERQRELKAKGFPEISET
ncbi:flagellar brake protein [Brockia lithotrophica]|uniref:C-di-GMP-binding flagellar brake protein YcgR n=1 Tax=Brockia lithotrophica TaxID=933949 RepID=A0A660KY03_9BACL|nr:PilZ domain-containing protein [Brockia lithotrophica]RKQ85640.1 c-di-GMP-binding flagellar brake protein YcgR [Brockia lithotrophica]